jgi:hypothetical protein
MCTYLFLCANAEFLHGAADPRTVRHLQADSRFEPPYEAGASPFHHAGAPLLPFRANAACRHRIPKSRYRVRN